MVSSYRVQFSEEEEEDPFIILIVIKCDNENRQPSMIIRKTVRQQLPAREQPLTPFFLLNRVL